MIEADPEGYLQKRFHVREHLKTIEDRNNGATLKIKTFDMRVMTGTKPVARARRRAARHVGLFLCLAA